MNKTITNMRQLKKNYFKPTPTKWRKLGDALLGVALFGIPSTLAGHEWVGVTMFGFGVVGKFLTNFFKEDDKTSTNSEDDKAEDIEI